MSSVPRWWKKGAQALNDKFRQIAADLGRRNVSLNGIGAMIRKLLDIKRESGLE